LRAPCNPMRGPLRRSRVKNFPGNEPVNLPDAAGAAVIILECVRPGNYMRE